MSRAPLASPAPPPPPSPSRLPLPSGTLLVHLSGAAVSRFYSLPEPVPIEAGKRV